MDTRAAGARPGRRGGARRSRTGLVRPLSGTPTPVVTVLYTSLALQPSHPRSAALTRSLCSPHDGQTPDAPRMVWPFNGESSQTPRSGSVAARSPSVRDAAPRAAPSKLFGLVTLWDGSDSHECALPLWCQQARRLAAKIPPPWRTELVVMAPKTSGECDAHYVWSNVTATANRAYVERVRIEGSWKYLKHCTLLKWAVFPLSHPITLTLTLSLTLTLTLTLSH